MQEQFDIVTGYLRATWLKRRYILIFAWIICPLGWIAVTLLPNQYTSEAKVYADTQSILQPLLRGLAIQTDPSQKLNLMAKTLLNKKNLETIARQVDADVLAGTPEQYEQLIDELESDIKIASGGRDNLYTISYTGENPVYAKNVVQAALNVFIENTLSDKRLDAEQASEVITDQIRFYEQRLVESEKELADFKRKYQGLLPGSDKNYYSNIEQQKAELESAELLLNETRSRLEEVESQLDEERTAALKQLSTVETEYDGRIDNLEIRLDELLFRYTNQHPDVIETRRQLGELKALKRRTMARISVDDVLKNSPVYQDLKITSNELNNEIASLEVRVNRHQSKIEELGLKLDVVPDIEAMLTSLTRNYDVTRTKYEQLLARGESATISHSVGAASEDIKFKIIEPPTVPRKPSGPHRVLLLAVVLVVGLGIGVAFSLLISQLSPVVFSTNQLYRATGIPVFGVITATESSGILRAEKRGLVVFCILGALLILGFVSSMAINSDPAMHQEFINETVGRYHEFF